MIHVRIVSTYPPAFGLPEETIELTLPVLDRFTGTPAEAHQRILAELREGVLEVPAADHPVPYRFSSSVARSVVVW